MVLDDVHERDPDRPARLERDGRPLLRRPHQPLDRVGARRQLEELVEGGQVVEAQPVAPDAGGADPVAAGLVGGEDGVERDLGDQGRVDALEGVVPVERRAEAAVDAEHLAARAAELDADPGLAVGRGEQRGVGGRDALVAAGAEAVGHLDVRAEGGDQPRQRRDRRGREHQGAAAAEEAGLAGVRADHGDPAYAGPDGQHGGVVDRRVADQHEPGGRGALDERVALLVGPRLDRQRGRAVGERADPRGQPEQADHLGVDVRLRDPALADGGHQRLAPGTGRARHDQVEPAVRGRPRWSGRRTSRSW